MAAACLERLAGLGSVDELTESTSSEGSFLSKISLLVLVSVDTIGSSNKSLLQVGSVSVQDVSINTSLPS